MARQERVPVWVVDGYFDRDSDFKRIPAVFRQLGFGVYGRWEIGEAMRCKQAANCVGEICGVVSPSDLRLQYDLRLLLPKHWRS